MKFSEFAKILEEFYKDGMNKEYFVKYLFCNITKDGNKVDRSNITFAKYMEDNSIKPIAVEIKYYLDTEKFRKHLAKRERNINAKEKLCNAFKDCAPDINIDNVFDKITRIFVIIINDASNEPDRRCKATSNKVDTNISVNNLSNNKNLDNKSESFYVPISDIDIPKILEIIIDLSVTVEKLFDLGETIFDIDHKYGHFCANQMNLEIYKKFDNEYFKFVELNNKLRFYNCKYTNETLNNAVLKGGYLNKSSFISNSLILSKDITEYKFDLVRLSSDTTPQKSDR